MSIHRLPSVHCDHIGPGDRPCPNWTGGGWDSSQIRAGAKRGGWAVRQAGGTDYCPEHRTTKPKGASA